MKYWKPFNLLIAGTLCGVLGFAVPGWAATMDRIVAKVNKEIITQSELEERAFFRIMSLKNKKVQPMPSKEKVMYEELERMIEERLLIDAGHKLQLDVDEDRVTKAIDEIKRNNGLNDEDLKRMLESESQSMEDYKSKIRNQILISRVMNYEVRKRVVVSDEEVEQYYRQHQKEFWVPGKLKLRHILFLMEEGQLESDKRLKEQKAREALRKIRSGEKFEAIAKEYSEDVSAHTGGDLGEIERGKMVPEFEKAAFQLKEGEVSGLVKTSYGLHIIKVDQIFQGQTLPLDKVKNQITSKFKDEKFQNVTKAFLKELRDKAFVEIKLNPPPQPVVKEAKSTEPNRPGKLRSRQKGEPANFPLAPKTNKPRPNITQSRVFPRFQTFEQKLRYYKQLRDNNKITEGEYQKRKKEILNRL